MGRVSTTNKKEAKETGKIYLDSNFYKYFPSKKRLPRRCKICKGILGDSKHNEFYFSGFCSELCKDEYQVLQERKRLHLCAECQNPVNPMMRLAEGKYWVSSGVYPKYCKKCRVGKIGRKKLDFKSQI